MNRGGSGKSPPLPHKEAVEEFARNMADAIVRSVRAETDDFWGFREEEEMPGAIEAASREVRTGPTPATLRRHESGDGERPPPRPGLPALRSLDYPDAPPPTPLLPGARENRQSFTRRLKGGLANEFSPSPPPPTPRDDRAPAQFDARAELVQHLMRSLSVDESGKRSAAAARDEAVATFAEALSSDVVRLARSEVVESACAELLATQMASAIVKCSLDEAALC